MYLETWQVRFVGFSVIASALMLMMLFSVLLCGCGKKTPRPPGHPNGSSSHDERPDVTSVSCKAPPAKSPKKKKHKRKRRSISDDDGCYNDFSVDSDDSFQTKELIQIGTNRRKPKSLRPGTPEQQSKSKESLRGTGSQGSGSGGSGGSTRLAGNVPSIGPVSGHPPTGV